ncbi:hypothetical protein ACFVVX_03245 [Kitasatospora sp. NPDC058170]|uniref:hypothetical protein n=1 Tax=Kitasatospora sp. NPDC058170 TaxID=3346364 RepID=UPI0036D94A6D
MDHWVRPGLHWHSYSWVGSKRPDDAERRPPEVQNGVRPVWSSPVPPLEVMHWLAKSATLIRLTTNDPAEAMEWLGKQLADSPAPETDLDPVVRLDHAREFLGTFPHDVVWTYWTPGQQLRSVATISCPRTFSATGETPPPCPLRRG